jgi:MATE family multidrug resistance protein
LQQKKSETISIEKTCKEIVQASIPTILTNLLLFIVQLTNIYHIGRLNDPRALGAVGLGNMLINVVCFATCWGFNGTLETYVTQSFGSGNTYMCGVQLNRGRIIGAVMFVPIAILFYFVDSVLISVGQDPEISEIARDYIVWALPGLFFVNQFDACKRYL